MKKAFIWLLFEIVSWLIVLFVALYDLLVKVKDVMVEAYRRKEVAKKAMYDGYNGTNSDDSENDEY